MTFLFDKIGEIRSPYQEKFAVPRQPNLVKSGVGELHLTPEFSKPEIVRGIEQFSHLWLLFIFNHNDGKKWSPTVRPPRLGGNARIGVFASRSTFRPNPIGLSCVELKEVFHKNQQVILKLGAVDLVDKTPIIDIKPYIPYSDSYPDAKAGYADLPPSSPLFVEFTNEAKNQLIKYQINYPNLQTLITEIISLDPRPAYKQNKAQDDRLYGMQIWLFNIKWTVNGNIATVKIIEQIKSA